MIFIQADDFNYFELRDRLVVKPGSDADGQAMLYMGGYYIATGTVEECRAWCESISRVINELPAEVSNYFVSLYEWHG